MRKTIGLILIILQYCFVQAQVTHFATPFIKNYQDQEYKGGTQNWDICQHPNGMVLFANNDGLLEFDGTNWQLYSPGKNSMIRSIQLHEDRIYIGGQREIGFFSPDASGLLSYTSLNPKIPKAFQNFADVWKIEEQNDRIYFNASGRIYQFFEDTISILENENLNIVGKADGDIYAGDNSNLYRLNYGQLELVSSTNGILFTDIISLPSGKNHFLLSTNKKGLFSLKGTELSLVKQNEAFAYQSFKVNSLERINRNVIGMSTIKKGLLLLDNEANLVEVVNKKSGLQNNNVISIFSDNNRNVWLGLDHGIDFIAYNSPFHKILADGDQEGASYTAKIVKDQLFIGTSTGLYKTQFQKTKNNLSLSSHKFESIPGTAGQVWGLDELHDQLFLSHNDGGFNINKNSIKRVSQSKGAWRFLSLLNSPEQILLGTYDGLEILENDNGHWLTKYNFPTWKESCRILEQDREGTIWVAHPYRGIYKVKLDLNEQDIIYELLGEKEGLPSNYNNHLFNLKGDIYFTGESGIYQYDYQTKNFRHNEFLESLIGPNKNVIRLFLDPQENIWFVTRQDVGMLKKTNDGLEFSYEKIIYPELSQKLVRGFEFIYPYDESNVFIGAEKGMIHFNPSKYEMGLKETQTINLTKVELLTPQDSTLYSGSYVEASSDVMASLKRKENGIRFSFSSSDFEPFSQITYTTKLDGYDDNWSDWSTKTEKEFSNLSSGSYTFSVKARNNHFIESNPIRYTFKIQPAWYARTELLLLYCLLGSGFLLSLILFPTRRLNKLIEVKEKKLAQSEEEIGQLKNAQLQAEIAFKNQELATKTMHLLHRKQLIHRLEKPIDNILKSTTDKIAKKEILSIKKMLKEDSQLEDDWHQFSIHFDQVNNDFLSKMKAQYPQLTSTDLKLCAYLKMNLSTKEIAPLLNISIRGVETGRYRLRRKLEIDGSIDLYDFMNAIK